MRPGLPLSPLSTCPRCPGHGARVPRKRELRLPPKSLVGLSNPVSPLPPGGTPVGEFGKVYDHASRGEGTPRVLSAGLFPMGLMAPDGEIRSRGSAARERALSNLQATGLSSGRATKLSTPTWNRARLNPDCLAQPRLGCSSREFRGEGSSSPSTKACAARARGDRALAPPVLPGEAGVRSSLAPVWTGPPLGSLVTPPQL